MAQPLTTEPIPVELGADGVMRVRGTRVTVDTIWFAFGEGATAEEIVQQYPSLSLADAYQAIGYCLRHASELDAYWKRRDREIHEIKISNESKWQPEGIRARFLGRRQG